MFFYASKILWALTAPTNVAVGLVALGTALLFTRFWRLGRGLAVLGVIGLAVLGASPLSRALIRPLEDRFPKADDERPITGIVVLGGSVGLVRGEVVFAQDATRLTKAAELARRHPGARLVFTGGAPTLISERTTTEADAAAAFFRQVGIAPERLILENRARNTRENALFTRELIDPKRGERWLLVTSAYHMPRSVGCFRAVGLDLEPYPLDYRTDGDAGDYLRIFRELAGGMILADVAAREWVGLAAYRALGYTDALFPAPRSGPAIQSVDGRPMR